MRVSEVYASVQGEGPRTGQTTVFVRFGGCNLRCPGWPCDTQHAIDPAFRKEWEVMTPEQLVAKTFSIAKLAGAKLITLTGGEPFLQNNEELHMFVDGMQMLNFQVEAFTNGTLAYRSWAVENINMIMDWKLPGSGEDPKNNMRMQNLAALSGSSLQHAVKFVCKDEFDFVWARNAYETVPEIWQKRLIWYYGKVWNGDITDAELVEKVMFAKLPWRMNVQLHNYVWDPQERGR